MFTDMEVTKTEQGRGNEEGIYNYYGSVKIIVKDTFFIIWYPTH